MHITETPFLEDLCMLLIFRDAHLDNLKADLLRLYDLCVAKVYVCVCQWYPLPKGRDLCFLAVSDFLRESIV